MILNKEQAVQIAEQARDKARKKTFSSLGKVENRFIEVTESLDSSQSGKVRDVATWIVTFQKGTAWHEFALDSHDGQVIRQRWSR